MTFEEFLGAMQSLLGQNVIVSLSTYSVEPTGADAVDVTQQACAIFSGVLQRARDTSDIEDATPGTMAFLVGEDTPGGYANLYVSAEGFEGGYWIEEADPRGRQLVVLMRKGLFASIMPFIPPELAD